MDAMKHVLSCNSLGTLNKPALTRLYRVTTRMCSFHITHARPHVQCASWPAGQVIGALLSELLFVKKISLINW